MNTQTTRSGAAGASTEVRLPEKVKYVLYARKSTESEERQVLSIDSQIKEMLQLAEREKLEVVEMRRESHSAKETGQREVFNGLLDDIRKGKFNGILTWAPDRLSRNAGDLGALVDLMDQKLLLDIRTYGQRFSGDSPNEKFLLMILGSQAKLENDQKSVNVKRGLRMRCEMGLWPAPAPTGYLNEKRVDRKGHVIVDPERALVVKQMFEKVAYEGWSGRKIYHWLKFDMNFRSVTSNKPLTLSNIYKILQTPFYYGVFEYPSGSGNFYTGKHKPIITRELFEKAREQLKRSEIVRESKEFAFTRLITCAHCGSGITADEKYKKLKDGTTARYVYYGCNRSRNLHCKGGYMREEELIDQLVKLIDQLDVDELGVREKFEDEIKRLRKFQLGVLGIKSAAKIDINVDLKTYAKYLLREGSIVEKRELLANLKSRLVIRRKVVHLEKADVYDEA